MTNVGLGHVIVDFTTLVWMNVSRWIVAISDELLEKRIDIASDSLTVQCVLHLLRGDSGRPRGDVEKTELQLIFIIMSGNIIN